MLSKCSHPTCSAVFRYLSDGRVFQLEIPEPGDQGTSRRREYFWLCGRCCLNFTVVLKDGRASVRSRFFELMSSEHLEPLGKETLRFRESDNNTLQSWVGGPLPKSGD